MQKIQKHYQNRIAAVEAEVTASRWCFVTDVDRFLQGSTLYRTKRVESSVDPVVELYGQALLKEQGQ
jgi:hypothetical protein